MNNLTDREFWAKYWADHHIYKVPESQYYDFLIEDFLKEKEGRQFIELGGFPGYNCVYFSKKYNLDCTLLDFFIDKSIINKIEKENGVSENSIDVLEEDLFNYKAQKKYDLIMSIGLIEHFQNTSDIIQKHINFMNSDSQCIIILPNFNGLNGFLNKLFDKENYNVHNIDSMNITLLRQTALNLGMKNIVCDYFCKPMVWLEPKKSNRFARRIVRLISMGVKLFPFKGKLLSPYIYLRFTN